MSIGNWIGARLADIASLFRPVKWYNPKDLLIENRDGTPTAYYYGEDFGPETDREWDELLAAATGDDDGCGDCEGNCCLVTDTIAEYRNED